MVTNTIAVTFVGEEAVGEGVSKDAYSAFFESWYKTMDGEQEKIPSNTNFDDEDLEIIGKIITHAFITHGVFPIQLCKSAIKKVLIGDVSDEELLKSFMLFLPTKEEELVCHFAREANKPVQPVMDILTEYGIFENPTPANVFELFTKAAKIALIRFPCFPMMSIVKGMGPFWTKITDEMLDALYTCTIPSAGVVIDNIFCKEKTTQEVKIIT